MTHTSHADATPYVTKDGSVIRELMHPDRHPGGAEAAGMSLAEALVPPGSTTFLHRHKTSLEFYHVTSGRGRMTLGPDTFDIGPGDTVRIAPGVYHRVENTGDADLVILCCCAPPYGHEDTELVEETETDS